VTFALGEISYDDGSVYPSVMVNERHLSLTIVDVLAKLQDYDPDSLVRLLNEAGDIVRQYESMPPPISG